MAVAAVGAACLEERARLTPPFLTLLLDDTTVCSPDTASGTVRAEDMDGIDSLWVTVDDLEEGVDGLLEQAFEARFRMPIRPGLPNGEVVAVVLRARDLAGFSDTLRRELEVIACPTTT